MSTWLVQRAILKALGKIQPTTLINYELKRVKTTNVNIGPPDQKVWQIICGTVYHITGTITQYIIYDPTDQQTYGDFYYTAATLTGFRNMDFSQMGMAIMHYPFVFAKVQGDASTKLRVLVLESRV